jgi:hypothetical protein
MHTTKVTRRSFLTTSAGVVAALAASAGFRSGKPNSQCEAAGALYGQVGRKAIAPGTAAIPSFGKIILLDGTILKAAHGGGQWIRPGNSVVLSPDASGDWSILYVEV